jgi:methylmalonyl-CoA mutase cobalamin-binding domain/chain
MGEDKNIYEALVNLNEKKVIKLVEESLDSGVFAGDIIKELQVALTEIGNRYEREEYFVPELIYSGEIMKGAMKIITPRMRSEEKAPTKGKVVIGTVSGDIHDIGKDLVVMVLRNAGFEVIDLGVDVAPQKFIETIENSNAKVLGMSCLLTTSFKSISGTVKEIEKAGIRDKVTIIIGGSPITELVKNNTGCDYYGKNAVEGLKLIKEVYSKN